MFAAGILKRGAPKHQRASVKLALYSRNDGKFLMRRCRPGTWEMRSPPRRQVRTSGEPQHAAHNIGDLKDDRGAEHSECDHLQFMAACDDDNRSKQNRRNENKNLETQSERNSGKCANDKKNFHLPPLARKQLGS